MCRPWPLSSWMCAIAAMMLLTSPSPLVVEHLGLRSLHRGAMPVMAAPGGAVCLAILVALPAGHMVGAPGLAGDDPGDVGAVAVGVGGSPGLSRRTRREIAMRQRGSRARFPCR